MIYRSNLTAPDLAPHFKHLHSRVMGHSFGHDVPSDWADKVDDDPVFGIHKRCGMWTHDEAAILYNVAKQVGGDWLDIGAHTGWTSRHITVGTRRWAYPIDPMHAVAEFRQRFCDNSGYAPSQWCGHDGTSRTYFTLKQTAGAFADGVVIDGDHEPGEPLADAIGAVKHLKPGGVILFHDFVGAPVREAVRYLMVEQGMSARLYLTPHVVACCWWDKPKAPGWAAGNFCPPAHQPDPFIVSQDLPARWPEFDWRPFIAPEP